MATRNDILSVSVGPENIAVLKAEAAKEGLPVSALVRTWVSSLASKVADDE